MKKVQIYTDGACSGNPGPGGYAAILVYNEHEKEITGAEENTTNNRMELMGAIVGLEALKSACEVTIYTDSKYVSDAFNKKWIDNWQRRGWRKSDKKPVLNKDLWQRLLEAINTHTVKFTYIEGHSGNKYNERCDELAVNARLDINKETYKPSSKTVNTFAGAYYVNKEMDKLDMWNSDFMNDMCPGGIHCSDDM